VSSDGGSELGWLRVPMSSTLRTAGDMYEQKARER